jgi:hypothetical protein
MLMPTFAMMQVPHLLWGVPTCTSLQKPGIPAPQAHLPRPAATARRPARTPGQRAARTAWAARPTCMGPRSQRRRTSGCTRMPGRSGSSRSSAELRGWQPHAACICSSGSCSTDQEHIVQLLTAAMCRTLNLRSFPAESSSMHSRLVHAVFSEGSRAGLLRFTACGGQGPIAQYPGAAGMRR